VLEAHGVHCALLDFGGQLLALDAPPGTPGWRVDVLDPRTPGERLETRWLTRASLSTTADTERGLVIGGQMHSHVIDPRTGRPVEGVLAAWVVHARATDADALSTALFVLGPERGLEWGARARRRRAHLAGRGRAALHGRVRGRRGRAVREFLAPRPSLSQLLARAAPGLHRVPALHAGELRRHAGAGARAQRLHAGFGRALLRRRRREATPRRAASCSS
jgi:hypothetical protein